MAICFAETDVRPMGRDAAGVRGTRLDDGDEVVSAAVAAEGKSLLTVTENGYGKRTAVESYLRGEDRPAADARRQGPAQLPPDREDRPCRRRGHRR